MDTKGKYSPENNEGIWGEGEGGGGGNERVLQGEPLHFFIYTTNPLAQVL